MDTNPFDWSAIIILLLLITQSPIRGGRCDVMGFLCCKIHRHRKPIPRQTLPIHLFVLLSMQLTFVYALILHPSQSRFPPRTDDDDEDLMSPSRVSSTQIILFLHNIIQILAVLVCTPIGRRLFVFPNMCYCVGGEGGEGEGYSESDT